MFWKKKKRISIQGKDNIICVINAKGERVVYAQKIPSLPHLKIEINGDKNIISIHEEEFINGFINVHVSIQGNNNTFLLDEKVRGNWSVTEYGNNNYFKVGAYTASGSFSAALHRNHVEIGSHCMISSDEELWTDGHSVYDNTTKELLNYPKDKIIIGNHVWLGRCCTLTKGAQIPDNCIVGIGSVVTKHFTESNCLLAGNPAKVCKKNINWDGVRPVDYKKN